jgi:chemotaxis protein methyltransferase CheR
MVENIGIVDTRNIISAVTDTYGFDMSDYTFTILKRRLIHAINTFGSHSADDFADKIRRKVIALDDFLFTVSLEVTEFFRDPSLWRELRDKYLSEISRAADSRIWMPNVTSGDELFSLAIVMNEGGLQGKIKIDASCPSQKHVELVKKGGNYDQKKIEVSEANYTRYVGKTQFASYYTLSDNRAIMKPTLLNDVTLDVQTDILNASPSKKYKMVIYRNKLLQFNIPLYDKVIRKLVDSLEIGGYLVIGNMETLEYSEASKKLQIVNANEKIYKKRVD